MIPLSGSLLADLRAGHTGWLPADSPYVFGLNLTN